MADAAKRSLSTHLGKIFRNAVRGILNGLPNGIIDPGDIRIKQTWKGDLLTMSARFHGTVVAHQWCFDRIQSGIAEDVIRMAGELLVHHAQQSRNKGIQ